MRVGLVSGPSAESELRGKYPKVPLNSLGSEIKTLQNRTSEHWPTQPKGADQKILLTIQPTRPSLADAIRITDCLEKPAAAKWNGASSHRRVLTPEPGRGLVSTMGPNDLFYSNTVGSFGVVSAGQNWGRLARAIQRGALKLVDKQKVSLLLFSYDALFLAEDEIFEEAFLIIVFLLMILGYPFSEKEILGKKRISLAWFIYRRRILKMRNFRREASFYARKSATIV